MFIQKTNVEGLAIIEPCLLKDARGYFFESFSQREFEEKVRKVNFVQDNESMSSYGVLRGLHFQKQLLYHGKFGLVFGARIGQAIIGIVFENTFKISC